MISKVSKVKTFCGATSNVCNKWREGNVWYLWLKLFTKHCLPSSPLL